MTDASDNGTTRAGFVAILGASNVGKSTLLNRLVGTKVSIVSPKVQTTRTRVLGIALEGPTQVIFVDTPGIFRPRRRLDRAMMAAAWAGMDDADLTAVMVDAARGYDEDSRAIVARLKDLGKTAVLVLNKVDLVNKEKLLPLAAELDAEGVFERTFMVSAEKGSGAEDLMAFFTGSMPEGPWLFPEDQVSDMPMRMLAAEITREQVFRQLHEELPYAITVETENWEERPDGSVRVDQVVYVQRPGQKGIVLGKAGKRARAIGSAARQELEIILEQTVHLFLFVKVREGWQDDPERFREMGLDYNA